MTVGVLLVGKYRVTREVGRGGMAAVYEAEHVGLGKKVAVKVLAAELSSSAIVIERFFREARAAASVRSPHIVDVHDSGRLEDGRPFIAMELLEGESLYDRMARIRIIDPLTTVRVIAHCAKGLMKAHALGIVHRDLKPENIFLTKSEDGEEIAKILDFGLAKFYSPMKSDEKTARLTREGAVFGTPAYMSPEQVKGQGSVDHRADLWALGCMAFECLTGRPVWNTDQGVAMTFAAIAAAAPPVPSRLRPDLPIAFDEWFKKALDRDVNKRFQTAKELADALARAFNAPQISLVTISSPGDVDLEAVAAKAEELTSESVQLFQSDAPPRVQAPTAPSAPRAAGLSATDLPPTAGPDSPATSLPPARHQPWRLAASVTALAAALSASYVVYSRVLRPQVSTPVVTANGKAGPAASVPTPRASASADPRPTNSADDRPWENVLLDGQASLASGDVEGALKKFHDAVELGGGAPAKAILDQVQVGTSSTGPCKLASFSHPRTGYTGSVGRPSVAPVTKGAVVTWTDDHEQPNRDHAYSVLIDHAGRPISKVRDLTPEAEFVLRPALLPVEDRVVLLYWDKSGREPGTRVRWLDSEGRIDGASILVSAGKAGNFWPSMDRAPDGFWVAYQDDRDRAGDDLFLRHLNTELAPIGPEVRATDYVTEKNKGNEIHVPSIAVGGNSILVAYALERDHKQHLIQRMRIALNMPELANGGLDAKLPAPITGGNQEKRRIRELGDVATVNEDRAEADNPALICGKDGCFLVWHGLKGGAHAALIEPNTGIVVWRKKFSINGGRPSVGVNSEGQVAVSFFERGRVRIATLSRDGVGTISTFGKVSGDQPRPWIVGGANKGEWYVSWLDLEASKPEAYVARLQCRN